MSDQICRYCDYQLGGGKYLCDPTGPNVCRPCQNLVELEIKIKETKMMLADLVNEHQKLKEQANYIHDRLTERLPPEVTGYIFELCIPEDAMEIDLRNMPLNTIHAPFIISTVCRRWRTIAHSTPQLWNTLFLCLQSSNSSTFPGSLFVQKWIDRAGLLPLSINIYVSVTIEQTNTTIQIIDMLNRYADRWLQLKYEGQFAFISQFSGDQDLPLLRSLHLKNGLHHRKYTLNLHPKRLNKLSITGVKVIAVNFSWRHLIQLEIGDISLSECFEALRRAPHLTHYTVRWPHRAGLLQSRPPDFPLPQDPIVHSNIHYLEFAQTLLYQQVLKQLSSPSLTTLVFIFTREPVEIPVIVDFLRRSGCSLERLSLLHANLSTSDIVSLCQEIPTLQHLHIEFYNSLPAPSLFALLAEFSIVDGKKEPRYLPALCSLALDAETIYNWTPLPNIFGTPAARSSTEPERHRHALESVAIYVAQSLDSDLVSVIGEETLKRILHLKEAGVKWKIQFGEEIIEVTEN